MPSSTLSYPALLQAPRPSPRHLREARVKSPCPALMAGHGPCTGKKRHGGPPHVPCPQEVLQVGQLCRSQGTCGLLHALQGWKLSQATKYFQETDDRSFSIHAACVEQGQTARRSMRLI